MSKRLLDLHKEISSCEECPLHIKEYEGEVDPVYVNSFCTWFKYKDKTIKGRWFYKSEDTFPSICPLEMID